MLIVLHICSFLMSNDSGYVSLGDTETIILYSYSGETYCNIYLGKFDFLIAFNVMVRILGSILNP